MKKKIWIAIITLFLITVLVSCKKETKTTEGSLSDLKITEQLPEPETGDQALQDADLNKDNSNRAVDEEITRPTDPAVTQTNNDSLQTVTQEPINTKDEISLPVLLDTPPSEYYISEKVNRQETLPIPLNIRLSENNNITDDGEWLSDHKFSLNTYYLPDSTQNGELDLLKSLDTISDDLTVTSSFCDDVYIYCIYGTNYTEGYILNIFDVNTHNKLYSLDFSQYRYSKEYLTEDYEYIQQKINWAVVKDNILYVSNSHNTYAKSSNHMNAYITAIDLNDFSILWRTAPLISNAYNFQIVDDVIICGYGFTDEDDFLYEINRYTGVVIDKISLKTAPYYIFIRDNTLYVRTYNTNYEFEIDKSPQE